MKQVTRVGVYSVALDGNKILLVSKGSNGCYRDKLDLPGGGIEFGETPEEALRREFLEETGRTFKSMHLIDNLSHFESVADLDHPYHFHHLGQIYFITGWNATSPISAEKHDWYDFHQLAATQLTPFAQVMIKELQNQKSLIAKRLEFA